MGMDPRCVGDVDTSGETAAMASPVFDQLESAAPAQHAEAPATKKNRHL
jgi:hypothetical protein